MSSPQLQYLRNDQIDKEQWDRCIGRSENGLIYARSYFLDAMTDNWDGVVLGDYEAVFPVPWRSKMTIRYVYPPFFIQQLGLIGSGRDLPLDETLHLVRKHFRFGECLLNFKNTVGSERRTNYILSLQQDHDTLSSAYYPNLRYDLRKAAASGLSYEVSNDPESITNMYKRNYGERLPHVKDKDYDRLRSLFSCLLQNRGLVVRISRDGAGDLVSGLICLRDDKRLYLIVTASTPGGRYSKAMHMLLDNLIREFSSSHLILDFEGSDIPGISHFYRSFGSHDQPYFFYRWNDLGFPLNLFKK